MTQKQQPLGSGFTAANAAADVLEGIDLTGRTAIVTGGHVGLGLETTRALSAAGGSVIIGLRNPEHVAAAVAGLERVELAQLDLMDPASIDAFASRYLGSGRALHMLINNAGIMGGDLVRDARGYESQFTTNHLGHFQLTTGLLPALRLANGARVVQLSSWGHHLSDIRWDDLQFETEYDGMVAYGQAKTANVLFAVELDRRWAGDGIRGYAIHPGDVADTNLAPWLPIEVKKAMGRLDDAGRPIIDPDRELKTPQQGASTTVWAATSPLLADVGGVYLKNNDIAPIDASEPLVFTTDFAEAAAIDMSGGVMPYAIDPDSAQRLWELSEKLVA